MDQKKLHILSLLAALTAATIFGMSFMFSKMALATAAPTVLLAFRFTVAVAAMSLVIALNALVGKVRGKPLFAFSLKGKPVGNSGTPGRTRTLNTRFWRPMLYQLNYWRVWTHLV